MILLYSIVTSSTVINYGELVVNYSNSSNCKLEVKHNSLYCACKVCMNTQVWICTVVADSDSMSKAWHA